MSLTSATSAAGVALGAVAAAAIGVAVALKAFDSAVQPLITRFADYNPQIAFAEAMAEVRRTFGDIRRANELGPQLARYINARSQLEQTFQDTQAKVLEALLPIATELLKETNQLLDAFTKVGEIIGSLPGLLTSPSETLSKIHRILVRTENALNNENASPEPRSIVIPTL